MLLKFCCLQVCPRFLWSHDCPKSPLCITDGKMSNDPVGFGRTTLDLLNQGRNHCSVGFIPPPPGAVPRRTSWDGWRCLGDILCWTGRGLWCSKSRCPFPTASGGFRLSTEQHPAGMPLSAVWSQAEQINTHTTFSLLTLPRYQTCWQLVSRQKRRKGKQTRKRRKKGLLVSAPHKKIPRQKQMDWHLRTKKAKHLLSHTPTRSPPTLTFWEKHKRGQREGGRKISSGKIYPMNSADPTADPGAA